MVAFLRPGKSRRIDRGQIVFFLPQDIFSDFGLCCRRGLDDKTFLDNYRTPHTDKLHVTERWRLIEDRKKLEILMTIDDPDTFNQPWQALRQYNRVNRTLSEDSCSENNINPFGIDYGTPVAAKPDF